MKIVLAFDSFKDSMVASTMCSVAKAKLLSLCAELEIVCVPMSDGGEGFLNTIELSAEVSHSRFSRKQLDVVGPLGQPITVSSI
jgi:glycerate kinase